MYVLYLRRELIPVRLFLAILFIFIFFFRNGKEGLVGVAGGGKVMRREGGVRHCLEKGGK